MILFDGDSLRLYKRFNKPRFFDIGSRNDGTERILIIYITSSPSMVRFYFDTEFTNGNYYLGDIIEMALLAEESGNKFHSYVRLHYLVPTRVKELTNISDDLLASAGCYKHSDVEGLETRMKRGNL